MHYQSAKVPRLCFYNNGEGWPRVVSVETWQARGDGTQAGGTRGCPGRKMFERQAPRTGIGNDMQCVLCGCGRGCVCCCGLLALIGRGCVCGCAVVVACVALRGVGVFGTWLCWFV